MQNESIKKFFVLCHLVFNYLIHCQELHETVMFVC